MSVQLKCSIDLEAALEKMILQQGAVLQGPGTFASLLLGTRKSSKHTKRMSAPTQKTTLISSVGICPVRADFVDLVGHGRNA